jgi:DNA-binding response OmpR family regulator
MERWGDHFVGLSKAVDVYVQRLRKKIQPHLQTGLYIHAVRGYGYKLEPPGTADSRSRTRLEDRIA